MIPENSTHKIIVEIEIGDRLKNTLEKIMTDLTDIATGFQNYLSTKGGVTEDELAAQGTKLEAEIQALVTSGKSTDAITADLVNAFKIALATPSIVVPPANPVPAPTAPVAGA